MMEISQIRFCELRKLSRVAPCGRVTRGVERCRETLPFREKRGGFFTRKGNLARWKSAGECEEENAISKHSEDKEKSIKNEGWSRDERI